ncbi:MAG: PAS domain S-box protein, partial [Methanocalculus sp. MSAO_Arc2]|uniref:PAS domain S-box protein n=1 Tax=Methanocalculus sp. MSAO_Arc2 TaxID=2293855 RepID=UPI000FEE7093
RWVHEKGRGVLDGDGEVLYLDGFILDITDRKLAEESLLLKSEKLRKQLDELVATQQQLRDSEAYTRTVLDNLPIGVAVNSVDPEVNFKYFNENFFRIYRTTAEALRSPDAFWDVVYEDPDFRRELRERVESDSASRDPTRMHWEDIPITRKGEKTTYISAMNIPITGKDLVISTIWDVTARVEAQDRVRLHLIRVQHLLNLHRMTDATEQALFNFTLDAALAMVESHYAFIGMMSGDESEMILYAWSQEAMKDCIVIDKPMHFPIASAGIWGECVRNRKPAVFNEYAASHPAKHGYPKGHVEITRYLGVPIFDGSRIVAVLAVANKETEYRDDDIDALMTLGNAVWGLIHRKRFDAVLRESEEKYRLIAENTADNILIFDMDFSLRYISPSVLMMKGFTVEESLAQTVEEMMTPASYASLLARFNQEMEAEATGTADPDRNVSFETEEYCKDGSTIQVENSTRLLRDDEGRPVGILGISRDITKRKQMERALRSQLDLIEGLFESLPLGVIIFDTGGTILRMNRGVEEITGYSPQDIPNLNEWFLRVYPDPAYRDEVIASWNTSIKGEATIREFNVTCKDGTIKDIEFHGVFLADGRIILTISDVTERRR